MELFQYQKEGAAWLKNRRHALLADEPGVGKSAQLIEAAKGLERIIIVAPAVALENWAREFKKFDPERKHAPVITSYDLLVRHSEHFLPREGKHNYQLAGVDEVHMTKEWTSLRSKAIFGVKNPPITLDKNGFERRVAPGLVHFTQRLWALSGTPMPRNASEMWVLFYTFGVTRLSYEDFVARFCTAYKGNSRFNRLKITGTNMEHRDEIRAMFKRIGLRRLKKDVLDLPPIFHTTFYVKSDADPLKLFPEMKEKLTRELEYMKEQLGLLNWGNETETLSALEVLAQSVSTLRRYNGLKKVKPALDLITGEFEAGLYKKLVIFCVHKDVVALMKKGLEKYNPAVITGETPTNKRAAEIDRFQTDPECGAIIANIKAAGVAVTLTAASQVILIESEWNPSDNSQAVDRCHRISQTESVTARYLTLAGSIDDKINEILVKKAQQIASILN